MLSIVAATACLRPRPKAMPAPTTAMPAPTTATPARAAAASKVNAPSKSSSRVTQANVVAIVLAANNTDVSYARLVPARSSNADVKSFAQRMLTDHTLLNTRIMDISNRDYITAEDNVVSLDFRDHSAVRRDMLRELTGAKFDSAYIANEIQYHQDLLDAISAVLVPSTKPGELRDFVTNLRPAVSAHLAHAEQIRATLASRR
jgi:putative membrane protein